jgi:peptide deformylase
MSAAQANTVSLASNQLGLDSTLIAISKDILPKEGTNLHWIHSQYNSPQQYQVYHRPSVIKGSKLIQNVEESISFPFLKFTVPRYASLIVNFID